MEVKSPHSTEAATAPVSRLPYRALLLQRANQTIPQTAEGLPVGFYRADLLPTAAQKPEEETQALKMAYSDLSFEYGYPTLPDGRPFWHKLDFEPGFAYGCFQVYLEQIREGPRELSELASSEELLGLITQVQPHESKAKWSAEQLNALLYEFSILYLWRARAKAHDIYKEAAFRHLRLRRQTSIEDEDYLMASSLLSQLREKVFNAPKFFEDMNAKTAADLLSKLVAIRRVSVGLPAAGPLSNKETPEDTSFEMIMRTLAQKAGQSGAVYENGGAGGPNGSRNILNEVLKDPVAAEQMQEVIIRVTKVHQQRLANPNPNQQAQGRTFTGRGRTQEIISHEDLAGPYDISGAPGENLGVDLTSREVKEKGDKGAD